jgi:hypothetical protein
MQIGAQVVENSGSGTVLMPGLQTQRGRRPQVAPHRMQEGASPFEALSSPVDCLPGFSAAVFNAAALSAAG